MIVEILPKVDFWIYIIVCSINGKIYVGKTKRMYKRYHQYRYAFENNIRGHINDHLMNAMIKYGFNSFKMIPWEKCNDPDHLAQRELFWIDLLQSTDRDKGYNLRKDSSSGMITHAETRIKISERLKVEWSKGLRNDHADKLKMSWQNDPKRHVEQSKLLSKIKTKWKYLIYFDSEPIECNFETLKILKMSSVIANFSKQKTNVTKFKGWKIERVPVNGSKA